LNKKSAQKQKDYVTTASRKRLFHQKPSNTQKFDNKFAKTNKQPKTPCKQKMPGVFGVNLIH